MGSMVKRPATIRRRRGPDSSKPIGSF
jgi:hypothetical protein